MNDLPNITTHKSKARNKWIFETKELTALNDREKDGQSGLSDRCHLKHMCRPTVGMNESLTDIFQFTNSEVQGVIQICKEEVSAPNA